MSNSNAANIGSCFACHHLKRQCTRNCEFGEFGWWQKTLTELDNKILNAQTKLEGIERMDSFLAQQQQKLIEFIQQKQCLQQLEQEFLLLQHQQQSVRQQQQKLQQDYLQFQEQKETVLRVLRDLETQFCQQQYQWSVQAQQQDFDLHQQQTNSSSVSSATDHTLAVHDSLTIRTLDSSDIMVFCHEPFALGRSASFPSTSKRHHDPCSTLQQEFVLPFQRSIQQEQQNSKTEMGSSERVPSTRKRQHDPCSILQQEILLSSQQSQETQPQEENNSETEMGSKRVRLI